MPPAPKPKAPAAIIDLIAKSNERLGRRQLWRVVRAVCSLAGGNGDDSCVVPAEELREALRDLGIFLSDSDFDVIATTYAAPDSANNNNNNNSNSGEGSGKTISVAAFLNGLRDSMVPRRQHVVSLAVAACDPNHTGVISMRRLDDVYDVMRHPDVVSGTRDEADVRGDFFDNIAEPTDDAITARELEGYLIGVSAATKSDEEFELLCIRSFCLDRPKKDPMAADELQLTRGSSRHSRQSVLLGETRKHPLYVSTYEDYGKDKKPEYYQRPQYGLTGNFASKQPPRARGGATTMNM